MASITAREFWERTKAGGRNVVLGAKQALAGAVESTIADTGSNGGYRPAILDSVPATVGVLKSLAAATAPKYVDPVAQGGYLDRSITRAQRGYDRTNRALGITDPDNTLMTIMRVAGSLAVPVKVPKVASAAQGATKAQKAAVVAKKVARGATEILVPMRQTGAVGATVAGTIATGLREGVDAVANDVGDIEYTGIADQFRNKPVEDDFSYIDNITTEEASADDFSYIDGDIDEATIEEIEETEKLINWETTGLILGAALAGGIATKYVRSVVGKKVTEAADAVPAFVGKKFQRSQGGLKQKAKAAIVQQDEPIRGALERFGTKQHAEEWGYKADRITNVSLGSKLRDQFLTGRMVGLSDRTVKLAPLGQAWAKELDVLEQEQVANALVAASALDDFRATGVLAALNTDKFGNSVNPRQLDDLVLQVRQSPKLSKYFDAVQESYRDLAKFRQLRGMDTPDNVARMLQRRPNYVGMNRNLETDAPIEAKHGMYSANDDIGFAPSRSIEESGGVQGTTGVGNPFIGLWDEWAGAVRRAELNDVRKDALVSLENINATALQEGKIVSLVKRLAPEAKDADNVHTVFINGKQQKFQINDPAIAKALHFAPRASIKALEHWRQAYQSMTTGPLASVLNLFSLAASPAYDTVLGLTIRPRGRAIGLGNELLNTNLPDPTAAVSAYIGALRYMGQDIVSAMSTHIASSLFQEISSLQRMLGKNGVRLLSDKISQIYEATHKAEMDRLGITSITMHGSPDPSKLLSGVTDVAPDFATNVVRTANKEIAAEAARGNIAPLTSLLKQSSNMFTAAKANSIARVYAGISEAMHNGFRLQAYATNAARVKATGNIKELDKLASDLRRISGDPTQHGGNNALNRLNGSLLYANLAVQSAYEVAKRFKHDPRNALFNMTAVLGGLAALRYSYLASDPEAAANEKNRTAEQRASTIITHGGMEIYLDPLLRAPAAIAFTLFDQMSGFENGEWNPDFLNTVESWLEGDDEEFTTDLTSSVGKALSDINPYQLNALPGASLVLGVVGVDPGMTRLTGETSMVHNQDISGIDTDRKRVDSLASGYWENLIASVFSTVGRSIYAITDDVYRAYGHGAPFEEAMKVGSDRWASDAGKRSGIFKPLLYGDREEVISIADTNWKMLKNREPGIEQATQIMLRDIRGAGMTSTNQSYAQVTPQEENTVPEELIGTELQVIGEYTQDLNRVLAPYRAQLKQLSQASEGIKNFYLMPQKQRTETINPITQDRKYITLMMLQATKQYEEMISARLGKPFGYDDFNPKDHKQAIAALRQ